jgi:hypothetical protein
MLCLCGADPGDEGFEAALQDGAFQEDAAAALEAAQADVGAEACDLPVVSPAGMRFPETHHVAEAEFEDG